MIELIGMIASIVICSSYFLKGEENIRKLNLIGSVIFIIYGIFILSPSIIFLNITCIVAHIINLLKLRKNKKD